MRTYRRWTAAAAALTVLAGLTGAASAGEFVWKDGKWVRSAEPAKGTAAGELAAIRKLAEQGEHKDAAEAVDAFLAAHPDDPACEEAMFLAAQAELNAERYYQAYEKFEAMLDAWPNGDFLERALSREMDIANAFLRGEKRVVLGIFHLPAYDEGITILRGIAEQAPGSDLAERAMMRIGEYYSDEAKHAEAADAYDEYLEMYPKGRYAGEAMLRAARAMHESHRGVPYDVTPLIEAEQRYKALIEQFPKLARKAGARQTITTLRELRAQRTFETAKFYDRTDRPRAAKFYFREVVKSFPDSIWAGEARSRLGAAGDKAPEPAPKPAAEPAEKPAEKPAVEAPSPEPAAAPAAETRPEPHPAPEPKPEGKSKARPTPTTAPMDLEKLAEPDRKGQTQ